MAEVPSTFIRPDQDLLRSKLSMENISYSKMSVPQLPLLPQLNVILSLTPQDLLNYCQVSQEAYSVCSLPEYIKPYLRQFGVTPEQIPGNTLEKKLGFLAGFNWSVVPGNTHSEKGKYIEETMRTAERVDPKLFTLTSFGPPRFQQYRFRINQRFSEALTRAVKTGNPRFVKFILNILLQKVGRLPPGGGQYIHSFRVPLHMALTEAYSNPSAASWHQIADLILAHYDARNDQLLKVLYVMDIEDGELNAVKGLSLIIPPETEGFWDAVESGRLAIAQFFHDYLLNKGIDPMARVNLRLVYQAIIQDNNRPAVEVLSHFVKPDQDIVNCASGMGAAEIAAFLQTQL